MQRNLAWAALTVGSIWLAVAIISFNGPDLIYGEDANTFPIIPAVTWISGAAASSFALRALVERHPSAEDQRNAWIGIAATISSIWVVVVIVCLVMPTFEFEFGSTPMILPLGQLITPAAGAVVTGVAGLYVPLLTDVAGAAERRTRGPG